MMKKAMVQLEGLSRRFPNAKGKDVFTVYEDLNLHINKGEFVCITGHSGCGKSTLMNTLAGLEKPTDGVVLIDNKEIVGPSLEQGVVFQNYSLVPWLTVLGTVLFGVRARWPQWSKVKQIEHCKHYLSLVGLHNVYEHKPSQLSGGMRQRVSIARAFATQPKLLLLDEPFGALDALTRGVIQDELMKICQQTHQTVFMITHDVDEAILLSDRVLLMSNGPMARIAESVEVNIPRPRSRGKVIEDPMYYKIRNYLVDFLINRSADYQVDKSQTNWKFPTTTSLKQAPGEQDIPAAPALRTLSSC
jgi:nitrate/nitrite transport system ATP-binding protein